MFRLMIEKPPLPPFATDIGPFKNTLDKMMAFRWNITASQISTEILLSSFAPIYPLYAPCLIRTI
jgi:hypothetical protein